MKTNPRFMFAVAIFIVTFANAQAGRWLSRDPIEEGAGFVQREPMPEIQLIVQEQQGLRTEPNLYALVGNNVVNHVDAFGLIKFEGCDDPAAQKKITDGFAAFCPKISTTEFKCCLDHFNIPNRLKFMCDHLNELTVKCEKSSGGNCKGACAWSLPGGKTIHLCPAQWNSPGCGPLGCTLLHEMTHMIGHGFEKWPQRVEKCLGCQ